MQNTRAQFTPNTPQPGVLGTPSHPNTPKAGASGTPSGKEIPLESVKDQAKTRRRMSPGNRIALFLTAWLIVLMPFLFWWNTWFGRPLSDKQISNYLQDDRHPRHIQHALAQIGERITRHEPGTAQWYPRISQLASYPVEEVRNTDAWVMGQDTSAPDFHRALLKMLADSSPIVRGNAALSLVRFGDASGRPQIIALLQPAKVVAPQSGSVIDASASGTAIREGGIIMKLRSGPRTTEVRSPIAGHVRMLFAQVGQNVEGGTEVAIVDPGADQVWEALRALYLVGLPEDLPVVQSYERWRPDIPDHVRQQALETAGAIRARQSRE